MIRYLHNPARQQQQQAAREYARLVAGEHRQKFQRLRLGIDGDGEVRRFVTSACDAIWPNFANCDVDSSPDDYCRPFDRRATA